MSKMIGRTGFALSYISLKTTVLVSFFVIIGKSLGHKSVSTTAIYARLQTDPVRQSIEKATSAMLEAGKQKNSGTVVNLKN